MKTRIILNLILAALVSISISSCNKSPKAKEAELNEAKQEVENAEEDLDEAKTVSVYAFNKYKSSIQIKLVENEKVITDLKAKIEDKDRKTQTLYYRQLENLQI